MSDIRGLLLSGMESYFGDDAKRITHARRVLEHAERLLERNPGTDRDVVVAAAVLHDIGIHEAERKHGSPAARFQELEGPPIARKIMEKVGMSEDKIGEVCDIIANHHTPGKVNTVNFKVLYDADFLVNVGEKYNICGKKKLMKVVEELFVG